MVSRKKKKGQQRKAKAASSSASSSSQGADDVSNQMRSLSLTPSYRMKQMRCYHGSIGSPQLPEDHLVHQFMTDFDGLMAKSIAKKQGIATINLPNEVVRASMIATRSECWQSGCNDLHQRIIIHLVSVGAEWRLAGNLPRAAAYAICIMQMQYMLDVLKGKVSFSDNVKCVRRPATDICQDAERGTAVFFSKKVDCDCFSELKKKYKSEIKMGYCSLCKVKVERKTLMLCSSCNSSQYCGKECRVKDWAEHKEPCRKIAENKKEIMERKERDGTWVEYAKAQLKSGAYSEDNWDTTATELIE